ncbi:hypothetical protein KI387_011345, partial [Taxus chinensis]
EKIVPVEFKGSQHAMEELSKIRVETLNGIKENLEVKINWVDDTLDAIDLKLEDMVSNKFKKSYSDLKIDFLLNSFEKNIQKDDFSYEIIKTMRKVENKITKLKARPL